jgi:hypothetical protein
VVDERGLVTPHPGRWSLDWWIGADDRWHLPADDAAVRQQLFERGPVVETAMRVPGGDAVQRVYAVPAGGDDLIVVEIENRSPVPFAVALAVRPRVKRVRMQGTTVLVDRKPALLLPKAPARMAASTAKEGDVVDVVTSGAAGTALPDRLTCRARGATAAFLFPLAHTAVLRVGIPLSARAAAHAPHPLPTSAQVAKGWSAQADRGMRFDLPEGRLADAVEANRRYLLMARGASARVAEATYERLQARLDQASPTFTWPDDDGGAFVSLVAGLLVRETADGLALCPELPDAWARQGLEVYEVPTRFGVVSFAVRWHGDRPALLWELDGPGPITITAPGLHPSWSTTDVRGEALLA